MWLAPDYFFYTNHWDPILVPSRFYLLDKGIAMETSEIQWLPALEATSPIL